VRHRFRGKHDADVLPPAQTLEKQSGCEEVGEYDDGARPYVCAEAEKEEREERMVKVHAGGYASESKHGRQIWTAARWRARR